MSTATTNVVEPRPEAAEEGQAGATEAKVAPEATPTSEPPANSKAVVIPSDVDADAGEDVPYATRLAEVARAFLPLGFVAFGGPQAHIGMFRDVFVQKKQWLDEERFLELMSLGQAMPGPTSTQVATAIGITRAGWLGGLTAFVLFDWVGFLVCIVVGSILHALVEGEAADSASVNLYKEVVVGMGPAAISQVFLAAYGLGGKVTGGDGIKVGLAVATCFVALLLPSSFAAALGYLGMMLAGGLVTVLDSRRPSRAGVYPTKTPVNKNLLKRIGMGPREGYALATATVALFVASWVLVLSPGVPFASETSKKLFALFQTLFRMGATIYGGGQVVLPMLENEFVNRCGSDPNYVVDFAGSAAASGGCSWVTAETFAFGLALAQSLPGPLFNFSAFLGAAFMGVPGGFVGFIGAPPPARAAPRSTCAHAAHAAPRASPSHARVRRPLRAGHHAHLRIHALLGAAARAAVGALHARRHERLLDRPRLRRVRAALFQICQGAGRGGHHAARRRARAGLQGAGAIRHLRLRGARLGALRPRRRCGRAPRRPHRARALRRGRLVTRLAGPRPLRARLPCRRPLLSRADVQQRLLNAHVRLPWQVSAVSG